MRIWRYFCVYILIVLPFSATADHLNGQSINGWAKVVSGGVMIVAKKRVALYGINRIPLNVIPWGPRARAALHRLTVGKKVKCRLATHQDDYEIAKCLVGKMDLAEYLVRQGLATADREQTDLYFAAEVAAEKASAGFWR